MENVPVSQTEKPEGMLQEAIKMLNSPRMELNTFKLEFKGEEHLHSLTLPLSNLQHKFFFFNPI